MRGSIKFQSTHPRGVRLWNSATIMMSHRRFQSTHPRGVRLQDPYPHESPSYKFQSTHPRGVRQNPSGSSWSIMYCFNPRTREGCDHPHHPAALAHSGFNPRTREGCDASICWRLRGRFWVSIHAPARGATLYSSILTTPACRFNPRTREGCDTSLTMPTV